MVAAMIIVWIPWLILTGICIFYKKSDWYLYLIIGVINSLIVFILNFISVYLSIIFAVAVLITVLCITIKSIYENNR